MTTWPTYIDLIFSEEIFLSERIFRDVVIPQVKKEDKEQLNHELMLPIPHLNVKNESEINDWKKWW